MILASTSSTGLAAEPPSISLDTTLSSEGYFVVRWSGLGAPVNALQIDSSAQFNDPVTYPVDGSGAMTLSGYPNGQWFLRAGSGSAWTDTVSLEVRHHPLGRAFSFFFLGLVLFLVLLFVIVRDGGRQGEGEALG